MMRHGGARQNAGRKKGSSSKLPLEQAMQAVAEEDYKTPLEVMLKIMNDNLSDNGDIKLALEAAKGAAPYMHAKLVESKTEITGIKRPDQMTDEELDLFIGGSSSSSNVE